MATSRNNVSGNVCNLFYGDGSTNYQTHTIYLGVTSTEGLIPAGTVLTWTITIGTDPLGRQSRSPSTNYSSTGAWTLSVSPNPGTATGVVTATLKFNQDYSIPTGTWCGPGLVWTNLYPLMPQAPISVSSTGTIPANQGQVLTSSLSYTAAKRHPPSVNTTGRAPHIYRARGGTQTCYPSIGWSRLLNSNGTDNVTTYPAGVTPPSSRCTWDGRFCNASPTGASYPAYLGGSASGQFNTPAVC